MGAGARAILPRSQGLGLITSHIPLAKVQSVIWQKPSYNLEMGEYTNFGICLMEEGERLESRPLHLLHLEVRKEVITGLVRM